MRKVIIISFFVFFLIVSASVKVESVFETSDVGEYNRWVTEHKAEYPDLKPIYINVETVQHKQEYRVIYYDDEGKIEQEEVIKGCVNVRYDPQQEKLYINEYNSPKDPTSLKITVKNKNGMSLFSLKNVWGLRYTNIGIYLEEDAGGPGYVPIPSNPSIRVFDENGNLLTSLENMGRIGTIFPLDSQYAVFKFYTAETGPPKVALINNKGNVLWRREMPFKGYSIFVSRTGLYIGINGANADGSVEVRVYNRDGVLLTAYKPFLEKMKGLPYSTFSSNSRYLVTSLHNHICLYDNTLKHLMWQIEANATSLKNILFTHDDNYIVCAYDDRIYTCDIEGDFIDTLILPLKDTWIYKKTVDGGVKKVYRPIGGWRLETSRNLILLQRGSEILGYKIYKME